MERTPMSCEKALSSLTGTPVTEVRRYVLDQRQTKQLQGNVLAVMVKCSDDRIREQGFKEAYRRYYGPVLGMVRQMGGRTPDGEDVLMETMEKLIIKSANEQYEIKDLGKWVYVVARNFMWKRGYRKKTESFSEITRRFGFEAGPELLEVAVNHSEPLEEERELLYLAIDSLSETARKALIMDIEGYEREEIQIALGHKSIAVTNNLISRARKDLIQRMSKKSGDPAAHSIQKNLP